MPGLPNESFSVELSGRYLERMCIKRPPIHTLPSGKTSPPSGECQKIVLVFYIQLPAKAPSGKSRLLIPCVGEDN